MTTVTFRVPGRGVDALLASLVKIYGTTSEELFRRVDAALADDERWPELREMFAQTKLIVELLDQFGLEYGRWPDGIDVVGDGAVLAWAVSGALGDALDDVGEDAHRMRGNTLAVSDEEIRRRLADVERFVALRHELRRLIADQALIGTPGEPA